VGVDGASDIFKSTPHNHQATRSRDSLQSSLKREIRVPDREAFEVVVVRGHHVEQVVRAVAVVNRLAVSGGFNRDGLVWRPALRQEVRAARVRAEARAVAVAVILIYTRVYKDGVARLDSRRVRVEVVGARRARVVR